MRTSAEFDDDPAQTLPRFVQQTRCLGTRIDVTNVAEAIDLLEGHKAG